MSTSDSICKIKIKYNEETVSVIVRNKALKKATLHEYFPEGGTLTYTKNNETFLIDTDKETIFINPDVDCYDLKLRKRDDPPSQPGSAKKARFHEILEKIYGGKEASYPMNKRKLSEDKICNNRKRELSSKQDISPINKGFAKRVVFVRWKHRKDVSSPYELMGSTIGPQKSITLNGNEDYSMERLKSVILNEYVDEKNCYFFDNSITIMCQPDETPIRENYINAKGDKCDFWQYAKDNLRINGRQVKIWLLTTNVHVSSNLENESKQFSAQPPSPKHNSTSNTKATTLLESSENIPNSLCDISRYSKVFKKPLSIRNEFHIGASNTPEPSFSSPKYSDLSILPLKSDKENFKLNSAAGKVDKGKSKTSFVEGDMKLHGKLASSDKMNILKLGIPQIREDQLDFSGIILGKGGQGVVSKGKFLGSTVAIKSMIRDAKEKFILREIKLPDKIRHPNIINIMAVCSTITQFHIVMEFFDSYSLHDILFCPKIRKEYALNVQSKNAIAYQVCCALTFLHLQVSPVIHRDVKPANVLVDKQFHTKVCDLGLGTCSNIDTCIKSTHHGGLVGTYLFMAPEIILFREEATKASDIWSFACTLLELYEEKQVWSFGNNCLDAYETLRDLMKRKRVPEMRQVPLFLKNKLKQCFSYETDIRPAITELLSILESETVAKPQS